MRALGRAALGLLLASTAAASSPSVDGEYESPFGRVMVAGDGVAYRGVVVAPAPPCAFRAGEEVLRATLIDDSLAGEVRVCLRGKGCGGSDEWGTAVLLASGGKLSGAVHVKAKGCKTPLGRKGGVAFTRTPASSATGAGSAISTPTPNPARSQARSILRDGAEHLREGDFEAARRRFLEAISVDGSIPEAYNGVGVTWRMRNDLAAALEWYKKALAVDPDFGDAYYNMACVYAQRGQKAMALRYLQIAVLNGYATADGIGEDPDLEPLRREPAYRALLRAGM